MMDILTAARPDRQRIVYLLAALAGVAAGLAIGLAVRATARWIPADARVVTVTPVFGVSPASALPHPASWEKPGLRRQELYFVRRVTIGTHTLPALFQYDSSEQPMQQRVLTMARVNWPYPLE